MLYCQTLHVDENKLSSKIEPKQHTSRLEVYKYVLHSTKQPFSRTFPLAIMMCTTSKNDE